MWLSWCWHPLSPGWQTLQPRVPEIQNSNIEKQHKEHQNTDDDATSTSSIANFQLRLCLTSKAYYCFWMKMSVNKKKDTYADYFRTRNTRNWKRISTIVSNPFHELSKDSAAEYLTTTDSPSEQKPMMFCTVVIFNLLYTCETWTLYRKRPRKFQHFQEAKFKQMAGLTHQQRSPQSLKNTKHWSHYPQTSPQVVRCHSNGPFKTPADHPLQWTHQRHTRSPKRRFNDQLKSFLLQAGISRNLGNRSHQSSIQTTSNSFRLFHQKKGERCKRKKIEGNAMLSSSDQDYHPPYYAM